MTANQRRPGFRLPWSSEDEPQGGAVRTEQPSVTGSATPSTTAQPAPASADERPTTTAPDEPEQIHGAPRPALQPSERAETDDAAAEPHGDETEGTGATAAAEAETASTSPTAVTESTASDAHAAQEQSGGDAPATMESSAAEAPEAREAPEAPAGTGFMHELVEAMRRVADEARHTRLAEVRTEAETEIREMEAQAERRRTELRAQAEADIAAVGEWAKAEAERIRNEAEQRVAARRADLERQLAAESARGEARAGVLRAHVSEYERELQAFHAKLSEIEDPAEFAAAVKRMPRRPGEAAVEEAETDEPPPAAAPAAPPAAPAAQTDTAPAARAEGDNGVAPAAVADEDRGEMQAAEPELQPMPAAPAAEESEYPSAEPTFTEIVVKGLGSFGAITGFRQQLAGVPGIDAVGLSLGTTGEFIFKATHAGGFDVATSIRALEGDAVTIEHRPEGGLRVTLDRPR